MGWDTIDNRECTECQKNNKKYSIEHRGTIEFCVWVLYQPEGATRVVDLESTTFLL